MLDEHQVFAEVAERRSFSAAAQALGLSRSYVSRRVAALEERLGVRLLHRTTRRVTLTDEGVALSEAVRRLQDELSAIEGSLSGPEDELRGQIRLALPHAFGTRWLLPAVLDFQRTHPKVRLALSFSERKVDVVGERFDLAVRGGTLRPSSLITRRLLSFEVPTVASPDYLARRGRPEHPRDLGEHACIPYLANATPERWSFERGGEVVDVAISGPLASDAPEAVVAAAVAGVGIARMPDWLLTDQIGAGELVRVMDPWVQQNSFFLVLPARRHVPVRVRRLIEHLEHALTRPGTLRTAGS